MKNRSADATIKGYYYQFNKTLESILDLPTATSSLIIEGIEDIDVDSMTGIDYVQCKYYAASKLTNSAIREPLSLMLAHFVKTKKSRRDFKYTLFGYFKEEASEREVVYDVNEIKSILTYKEKKIEKKFFEDEKISDYDLTEFSKVFVIQVSKEFESHQKSVITKLKSHFKCSEYEAENYYLNNSLKIIFDKAIQKNVTDRKIIKSAFLKQINCKRILFFHWFKRYQDDQKYIALQKKAIKHINLFSSGKEKLLVLGKEIDFLNTSFPIGIFIIEVADLYYKISKSTYLTKPITFLLDITQTQMIDLKKFLISENAKFNDGHEEIQFCHITFSDDPIINRKNKGQIISKSSFQFRLLSLRTFKNNYGNIKKKFSVLFISEDSPNIPDNLINQFHEVKYLTQLNEIIQILK